MKPNKKGTKKNYYEEFPDVKQVIHNKAYTIVIIKDRFGEEYKGITRCRPGTRRDKEKGFWIAYAKAQRGKSKYYAREFDRLLFESYERIAKEFENSGGF